jgi:uncharacterized membrane protein
MLRKLVIFLLLFFSVVSFAEAQDYPKTLEGVVSAVVKEEQTASHYQQQLKVKITRGDIRGEEVIVRSQGMVSSEEMMFDKGDEIVVEAGKGREGETVYFAADYVRRPALFWLFLIFIVATIGIGGWRGLSSLLGMVLSFIVIVKFILPFLNQGYSPFLVSLGSALMIIPATFYLSHGFKKKTTIAVAGTLFALFLTIVMAEVFVKGAHLTGFVSEEAGFLQQIKGGEINVRGLLLAGIVIGSLGILDDVSISQAGVVDQLAKANPKFKSKELFIRAMKIGKDHIASMVNTLILVYTGAALPLLLLFTNNPKAVSELINYEIVAEEIVRTLVGSIGLITAVPITTFLAVRFLNNE